MYKKSSIIALLIVLVLCIFVVFFMANLLCTFICVELTSIIGYIFIIIIDTISEKEAKIEAGLKYFFSNFFGTLCFILALTDLSNTTILDINTFNYSNLKEMSLDNLIFLTIAFILKLNLFPIFFWGPEIYAGCAIQTVLILSTIIKPLYIFAYAIFIQNMLISTFISYLNIFCGLGSVFIGLSIAQYTTYIKRFFAGSALIIFGFLFILISIISPLTIIVLISTLGAYIYGSYFVLASYFNIKNLNWTTNLLQIKELSDIIFGLRFLAGLPPYPLFLLKILLCLMIGNLLDLWIFFIISPLIIFSPAVYLKIDNKLLR